MNEPRKPTTPIVVEAEDAAKPKAKPLTNSDCCCAAGCTGFIGLVGFLLAVGVLRRLFDFAFGQ
jgi:hypothetical protein